MRQTSEYNLADGKSDDIMRKPRDCCYWRSRPLTKTICCSIIQFIHIGFLYNFGLFFDELQKEFHSNATITGWVGSISYCILTFGTILSTWVLRHLSYRKVVALGIVLGSLSLVACSFAPSIIYLMVLYGVFFGMSTNVSLFVTLDFMVVLFEGKQRARAMALVTVGATTGNLSMSNLIEYVLELVGWRWTFRIFACILLMVGLTAASFLSAPVVPDRGRVDDETVDTKTQAVPVVQLIRLPEAWLITVATFTCAVAMVFQYVNMASFFVSIGLTDQKSATGISVCAFGDSFAKVLFIVVAPCISFPLIYCLPVCLLLSSLLSVALTQTKNMFVIFIISFCYGMPRGICNALQLATGLEVFGTSRSKTSANLLLFWSGIGYLTGPYVHGSLYDANGSYYSTIYLCAALYLVSSVTMLATPLWQKYLAPDRYMVDYKRLEDKKVHQNHLTEYLEQMISVV